MTPLLGVGAGEPGVHGGFELIDTRPHEHVTPWGATQKFQFSTFRRERDE